MAVVISSDGLQSSYPYLDMSTSLGGSMVYSARLVSPYSYLVFSSDVDFEVEDASEGIDEKSRGLFPLDEEDLVCFFGL